MTPPPAAAGNDVGEYARAAVSRLVQLESLGADGPAVGRPLRLEVVGMQRALDAAVRAGREGRP
jgi:hypothetical protein